MSGNGSGISDVADLHHKSRYEAPQFNDSTNVHTKHVSRHIANTMLADAVLHNQNKNE
jgi:hypothetical protein